MHHTPHTICTAHTHHTPHVHFVLFLLCVFFFSTHSYLMPPLFIFAAHYMGGMEVGVGMEWEGGKGHALMWRRHTSVVTRCAPVNRCSIRR